MRRRVLIYLLVAVCAYTALTAALWLAQDSIVFPGAGYGPRTIDAVGVRSFTLDAPAGAFRVAEYVPEDPAAVLVFFVGNGEDLVSAGRRAQLFGSHGLAVVCPEYPGYGGSAGKPGVESFYAAARTTAEYAATLASKHGIPLVGGGISLGSFSATHIAQLGLVERLFLAAPPTSLLDVASARYWWLPLGLLLRHRFDNLEACQRIVCPVLVVHGEADRIVPIALGERVVAALPGPKEFVRVAGVGHNDLPLDRAEPVGRRIGEFLRGQ
jgi:pimeloyl-ACP methyl ester carboxylesterase